MSFGFSDAKSMKSINKIIKLAKNNIKCGVDRRAGICLKNAVDINDSKIEKKYKYRFSALRALKSLEYSVGKNHKDYIAAKVICEKERSRLLNNLAAARKINTRNQDAPGLYGGKEEK